MKVLRFVAVALIGSFVLNSCGGGAGGEIGDVSTANEIIGFNNEIIDYLNETGEKMEKAAKFSDQFAKMVEQKRNNKTVNNRFIFIGAGISLDKALKNIPSAIPEEMRKNLAEIDKNYQKVKEVSKAIGQYQKNEDFKDDDWKKGGEDLAVVNAGISKYYELKGLILTQLNEISDKAEEKILEGHPLKDPILAAKSDIKLAGKLRALLFSETLNRDSVQAAYDKLEKSSQQHKDAFIDALKEQNKKVHYDSFHENIERYLGDIRKRLRDNKAFKKADYNSFSSGYEAIIGRYNSFVN